MPPNTRPGNKEKDKKPKPKNRRTPKEVSDERAAAATRRKKEKAEGLAAQREVAEFEDEERQRTANRKARSGRPRYDDDDEQMEKANHKRAASSDVEEGTGTYFLSHLPLLSPSAQLTPLNREAQEEQRSGTQ
jgi:hypothetical protein